TAGLRGGPYAPLRSRLDHYNRSAALRRPSCGGAARGGPTPRPPPPSLITTAPLRFAGHHAAGLRGGPLRPAPLPPRSLQPLRCASPAILRRGCATNSGAATAPGRCGALGGR